jgi:oligosaccharide repeat unit polymerase
MDFIFNSINAMIIVYLLLIFILIWKATGIWFHPSALLSVAWFIYLAVPFVVGFGYPINPIGAVYVAMFVCMFVSTTFIFSWKPVRYKFRGQTFRETAMASNILIWYYYLFALIAVLGILFDLNLQGFTLSGNFLDIGGEYAGMRYSDDLVTNIYARIGLLASFQTAILGGVIFGMSASNFSRIKVVIFTFFPAILVMLLQSAKGLLLLSASLFIGGWLVTRLYKYDYALPRISPITVVSITLAVVSMIFVSFVARVGLDFDVLKSYFASYSSGHIYAFSAWLSARYFNTGLEQYFNQPEMQVGFYTFMGIFQTFGDMRPVPLGVYDEFYIVSGLLETNVYTAFRGLISDFGFLGSLIIAALSGFFANVVFYFILSKDFSPLSCVIYIYIVGLIYQSYIISSFTWISVPASFVITYIIFLMAGYFRQGRGFHFLLQNNINE